MHVLREQMRVVTDLVFRCLSQSDLDDFVLAQEELGMALHLLGQRLEWAGADVLEGNYVLKFVFA